MSSMVAEQIIRATLARLEADRQEAITTIELYLNSGVAVPDHSSVIEEVSKAVERLAASEESISAVRRNFLVTEAANDE